jgi:predicted O-linked N-acetylglucosamine transferase (SPINDLY family)
MSMILQNALKSYQAGKYRHSLALLTPLLAKTDAGLQTVLLAAQCHAKAEQYGDAAKFYSRASELDGGKQAMFKSLAAAMLVRANESKQALTAARYAARSGDFNIEGEHTYRRCLHNYLSLEEAAIEDQRFLQKLKSGETAYFAVENPFDHISWCADEAINAKLTRIQSGKAFTAQSRAARRAQPHAYADRIRIGYLSNDFADQHATMRLFQGVILRHDPEKFDVTLFCHTEDKVIGADKGMRKHYGRIVRIGHLSDEKAAQLIRKHDIDILVDLKGHTKHTRIDLINLGPAPIQAAYLGFPGSGTGIDCDYVISDPIVTPDSSKEYYHEKLCRLPESYQANDDTHRPLSPAATRAEAGLPETAIVFASFNATRKITPATARLWVKILDAVPGSVLWMMCEDEFARSNFLQYVTDAGLEEDRVIFAKSVPYEQHVARLQAADIGLDTFPYNGHTTTSDKLWAGLPVVTMRGSHFASRVSESLLTALDMPELVAPDAAGYVKLCTELARDPQRLKALREKLVGNRFKAPLFDTERFTRHLEDAYQRMVERAKAGLEPDHIDVPALPARTEPFRA